MLHVRPQIKVNTSPRRRINAAKDSALKQLANLLADESRSRWAVGDHLVEMVRQLGFTTSELAERFGKARTTLSAYRHTAMTFEQKTRDLAICWNHYDNARRAASRFDLEPGACLKQIVSRGLTQRREVTAFFAEKQRKRQAVEARNALDTLVEATSPINRCHPQDCRVVAQLMPKNSVKIAMFDFPYGAYGSSSYLPGKHDPGAAARTACDGNDSEQVTELIRDMLELMQPKMRCDGCALLFRPGGVDPLYTHILDSIRSYGWDLPYKLTWNKGRSKLGRPDAPYAPRTESIYVLCLSGEELCNHDGSSMDDLLEFAVPRYTSATAQDHHLFAKPIDLCRHLIEKHSHPGELVFDACGCSGNACLAAIEAGRSFVYCETNAMNYAWGSRRIEAEFMRRSTPTMQSLPEKRRPVRPTRPRRRANRAGRAAINRS